MSALAVAPVDDGCRYLIGLLATGDVSPPPTVSSPTSKSTLWTFGYNKVG